MAQVVVGSSPTGHRVSPSSDADPWFAAPLGGYRSDMLWTILIILAIIALVLFILGRRSF